MTYKFLLATFINIQISVQFTKCLLLLLLLFQVNEVEMNFRPGAIYGKNYENVKKKKKSNDWVLTINCSVIFIFRDVRVRIKG